MTRSLHIDVDLSVEDDADDMDVADAVLDLLCTGPTAVVEAGMVSCDGAEPLAPT